MSVAANWIPHEGGQRLFMTCPFFEALAEGNRGGGKTDLLLMTYAQYVGRGFGEHWRGIIFRRSYPELGDVIKKSRRWFSQIFPEATYNKASSEWEFPDGETLLFRHMAHVDDYWSYHGHEYPFIGWEELTTWPTLDCYKQMMSCCRSSFAGVTDPKTGELVLPMPRIVRSTTNPYGKGHNAVKDRFQLPARRNKPILDATDDYGETELPRVAVNVSLGDNKALLEADPTYLKKILGAARNESERKAWRDGDWDIVAGGMFDDVYVKERHVIKPFVIPSSWTIDRAFDWGSSKPFATGWFAESDGTDYIDHTGEAHSTVRGDIFLIGEYYGWNGKPNEGVRMLSTDVAKEIIQKEQLIWPNHYIHAGPADSSIFDSEDSNCIADNMASQGCYWTRANKSAGSRKAGWEKLRELFQAALPNEDGTPRENPGLFIFETCEQFQRTIPTLPRSDKDPDDVDTDVEDHYGDMMRYRVYKKPSTVSSNKNFKGR